MGDAAALLKAVEGLYGAALAPERWPSTIEGIADLLGCDHALVMVCSAVRGEPVFHANVRVDPYHVARLCSPESVRLTGRIRRSLPFNAVFRTEAVVVDDEAAWREHYNEFVRPMNGGHALAARPRWSDELVGEIAFCRRLGDEIAGAAEAAMLQALLPHLANAMDIQHRLRTLDHQAGGALRLLDRLAAGVILADERGQPCFVNPRARQLLAEADGLVLNGERLAAATAAETYPLRNAIAAVSDPDATDDALLHPLRPAAAPAQRRVHLTRPSLRPPLVLTLVPIWRVGMQVPGARAPRVAIWIAEPDARAVLDEAAVAEVFRLTPREASLATLLSNGFDLKGAATILGIKPITARNYLKRAFHKTHVHSQAALVALVRGLADPLN